MDSGDWKCDEEEDEDKTWISGEDEEKHCFHKFENHLKSVRFLSGGDFKNDFCEKNVGSNELVSFYLKHYNFILKFKQKKN